MHGTIYAMSGQNAIGQLRTWTTGVKPSPVPFLIFARMHNHLCIFLFVWLFCVVFIIWVFLFKTNKQTNKMVSKRRQSMTFDNFLHGYMSTRCSWSHHSSGFHYWYFWKVLSCSHKTFSRTHYMLTSIEGLFMGVHVDRRIIHRSTFLHHF